MSNILLLLLRTYYLIEKFYQKHKYKHNKVNIKTY